MVKRVSLELQGSGRTVDFSVSSVCCAGYTGRDRAAVEKHVEELKRLGVPAPSKIPTFYWVSPYILVSDGEQDYIEVKGEETSAEVEWAAFIGDEFYVTVGSDHTDRWLEKVDVGRSKQVCQKVFSHHVWAYPEVKDSWDSISIRSWVDGGTPYQEGTLSQIQRLEDMVKELGLSKGTVLFSGTLPTKGGQLVYGDSYKMELDDRTSGKKIELEYRVKKLPPDC